MATSLSTSEYPCLAVTVDVALIAAFDGALWTWVQQRQGEPFADHWALPGGFVQPHHTLEDAASAVLQRKMGCDVGFLEQLYTFGAPQRDPRMRVVTVAYYALLDRAHFEAVAHHAPAHTQSARLSIPWTTETGGSVEVLAEETPLAMAFDHRALLGMAVQRLRGKLDYTPVGFRLLGERFTLRALQAVHETIRGVRLNKDSFRRRLLASGQLVATGEREDAVGHRPAELYSFLGKLPK